MDADRKYALELIQEEVERVEAEEGFTLDHDKQHVKGELAEAAAYYCFTPEQRVYTDNMLALSNNGMGSSVWPFGPEWFKSETYRIHELVKAGQFIVAEIARLYAIRHDHIENVLPEDDGSNMAEFKAAFTAAMLADNLPQSDVDHITERGWQEAFGLGEGAIDAYKEMYYEQ